MESQGNDLNQHLKKRVLFFVLLSILYGTSYSCDLLGSEKKGGVDPPKEKETLLVAGIGNTPSGFWFLNTDSLKIADSLYLDYRPDDFVVDSITQKIFWINAISNSVDEVYSLSYGKDVTNVVYVDGNQLELIADNSLLLVHGLKKTKIVDPTELKVLKEGSIGVIVKAFSSKEEGLFYGLLYREGADSNELIFATISSDDLRIIESKSLGEISPFYFSDAVLSENEDYIYIGYTEVEYPYEYGKFGVFNTQSGELVEVFECGPNPKLAVSSDGLNIFIGWSSSHFEYQPKNTNIYLLDVVDNSFNTFLSNPSELGLQGNVFFSDVLIVSPDSKSLFIKHYTTNPNSTERTDLVQIDILEKKVLNIFGIPSNSDGETFKTTFWGFNFLVREIE